jgi:membrane protease subunit HflC
MKNMLPQVLVVVVVLAALLISSGVYIVQEGEQGIVTQFGKPVGEVSNAGIHFKVPFIQKVLRFERRILKWDGDPNQIPTSDKKFIWIDTTARWRIVDPLLFFKTVGTERGAQSRLDDILDSVVRDSVSGHLLFELVRGKDFVRNLGRSELEEAGITPEQLKEAGVNRKELVGREEILADILLKARASTPEYGIDLIDVQIKRINYVEQVRTRVYERMINERKKVAAEYRSEGEGEKAEILGQMEKELKGITSGAYRKSIEIRGEADAKASAIYAQAYNQDKEFYAFLRTLESYKKAIGENGKLVLSTDSDFYRYLKQIK